MKVIFLTKRIDHSLVTRRTKEHPSTYSPCDRVCVRAPFSDYIEEGVNNDGKILFPPKNNTKKMRNLFDMSMEWENSRGRGIRFAFCEFTVRYTQYI